MNRKKLHQAFSLVVLISFLESASAVEFIGLGDAVIGMLKTKTAKQKMVGRGKNKAPAFYTKKRFAVVEKGLYPPNCTHTWVIGFSKKCKVTGITPQEYGCPHANPTKKASFLDQYKGKGPADVKTLRDEVMTVAKATGSSDLMTDAVIRAEKACMKHFKISKKKKKSKSRKKKKRSKG